MNIPALHRRMPALFRPVGYVRYKNALDTKQILTLCASQHKQCTGAQRRWGHSFSRNLRALARSSSCSSVKPISVLPGAPVTAAVEPHHISKMRPQTLRPGCVRRLAPFGRARNFGRSKMVERHITLGGAGAAVAASAQGARDRAECRDMLLVVPFVEIALVLGSDVHCDDQQGGGLRGGRA